MDIKDIFCSVETNGNIPDAEVTGVTDKIDKVIPGSVYFCIKGARFDGHQNAALALEKGAAAVVAEYDTGAGKQVIVKNTRSAYALACGAFFGRPADKLKIIAVTGTNGKTTTAFLVKQIFDSLGYKTGLIGTVKNIIGDEEYPVSYTTPECYELHELFAKMVSAGCTHVFMEVSSQALAQKRVDGIKFAVGAFTNLTQDHLDYHKTMENYAAAKAELFNMCDTSVVNIDADFADLMLAGSSANKVTFSVKSKTADYFADDIKLTNKGISYKLCHGGECDDITLPIPGDFNVYNSLAAVVICISAGLAEDKVTGAAKSLHGVCGRIEVVDTDTDYTFIIDYAHTPDGLENILTAVRKFAQGRIICVFGCGGDRDKLKRPIIGKIGTELSDIAVITSDNPRTEEPSAIIADIMTGVTKKENVYVIENRTEAIKKASELARPQDIVLLCGKGHETYQIIGTEKYHYDEREIIRSILN